MTILALRADLRHAEFGKMQAFFALGNERLRALQEEECP